VAYVSTRPDGYAGISRKPADGSGAEELLFRYTPGAGMVLTDWSPDGRFLTFYTGVIVMVPLDDTVKALDRKEIDWLREDVSVRQTPFGSDARAASVTAPNQTAAGPKVVTQPRGVS
jgi:hypothetical protein